MLFVKLYSSATSFGESPDVTRKVLMIETSMDFISTSGKRSPKSETSKRVVNGQTSIIPVYRVLTLMDIITEWYVSARFEASVVVPSFWHELTGIPEVCLVSVHAFNTKL